MPEWPTLIVAARQYGYGGPDTPEGDDEILELAKALQRAARELREPMEWAGIACTPTDYIAMVAMGKVDIDTQVGPCP
jgi:hypothetical protein